jgi:2-polyprenyl-6-methoxyphenol hydroxylase-like FAD-dependent oxidoreductase
VNCDVLIVGARVAGASLGLLLSRMGLDVVIIDRNPSPAGTNSTHCVSPLGVGLLAKWGLLEQIESLAQTKRINGFVASDNTGVEFSGTFSGPEFAIAPRREMLDPFLLEEAKKSGATVQLGVPMVGLTMNQDICETQVRVGSGRETIHSRIVVGADGQNSVVARATGAFVTHQYLARGSAVYTYFDRTPSDTIHFQLLDRAYVSYFPTGAGHSLVIAADFRAERSDSTAFRNLLEQTGAARIFESDLRIDRYKHYRGSQNQLRVAQGRSLLAGDAFCADSPVSGLGISSAFGDAQSIADFFGSTGGVPSVKELRGFQEHQHDLKVKSFEAIRRIDCGEWDVPLFGALLQRAYERKREGFGQWPVSDGLAAPT